MSTPAVPPLVVHLLYRLDFGGLETVLVDCINRMAPDRYRHAIVCLTGYTAFAEKITRPDVLLVALDKPPGPGLGTHLALFRLLRTLRPAILHTYNLSAVEYAVTAAAAGVPVRIHAEHGRDLSDPGGTNRKHNLLRRLMLPFIDCMVPVSRDLQHWLGATIGVPPRKNRLIHNGVDTGRFQPAALHAGNAGIPQLACPKPQPSFVIGTVGRIQDIKNHQGLVRAFVRLCELLPAQCSRFRLTIVGDGPLMPALQAQVAACGAACQIQLTGTRTDIDTLMRSFDVFVLPSFAEGTPITLLEAMACALPVVAADVGGIPDVVNSANGTLIAPADHEAIAHALAHYITDPVRAQRHGHAARHMVETCYSMTAMITNYTALYDALCLRKLRTTPTRKATSSCAE